MTSSDSLVVNPAPDIADTDCNRATCFGKPVCSKITEATRTKVTEIA